MATTWYAQNSTVDIDSVNEWNDEVGGGGNWLTWPPAVDDTLCANGKTAIAINVSVTCAELNNTGGGAYTVAGAVTLTCNIVFGTVTCIVTSGTGYTLAIVGNVSGTGAYNQFGIKGSVTITVLGNVTAGPSCYVSAAIQAGVVTVTGNVTGGATSLGRGVEAVTVVVNGNVTGGSSSNTNAVAGAVTVNGGNIINTASAVAVYGSLTYNPGAGNYIQCPSAGDPIQYTSGGGGSGGGPDLGAFETGAWR